MIVITVLSASGCLLSNLDQQAAAMREEQAEQASLTTLA
jgi:hypothetical protein